MQQQIVIVGAGHGAGQVVATLKQKKYPGRIILIGDEPYLPYQRPPLSKKFLAGEMPAERLYFKPESFYSDPNIDVHLNTRVTAIDPAKQTVTSDSGDVFDYEQLILATGSQVRELPVPGHDLDGVHYLRTIDDVHGIRSDFDNARSLVIVGAGYIGLEVAAVARQLGLDVTVLEMADRVMSRVVSPEVSAFYENEHRQQGVNLLLGTGLARFEGERGRVTRVLSEAGQDLPADVVVIGAGILPNCDLAAAAGLDVDNGIVVDDHCRSSDPNIFAIGDCTSHPSAVYGRSLRLESVDNALQQAKTAASNASGEDVSYDVVPWFWSDQYDLKLQIAGVSDGYDEVVIRGNPDERAFAALYLKEGALIAVDAINSPRDFMQSKALIAARLAPDKHQLADTSTPLKELG